VSTELVFGLAFFKERNMINLQLTQSQYDIVKAAVAAYSDGLMRALEPNVQTITITKGNASATVEIPARPWEKVDAPYGLKKDGTPKARPGRKTARKARA
jgi:hypothetical protein